MTLLMVSSLTVRYEREGGAGARRGNSDTVPLRSGKTDSLEEWQRAAGRFCMSF